MYRINLRLLIAFILTTIMGCSQSGGNYRNCDPVPEQTLSTMPERLSESGLYSDISQKLISPELSRFTPNYELWTDGASKRRWVKLPKNSQIDTRDANAWNFPVGTKFWKEFSQNGVAIETRLLQKITPEPNGWAAVSYVWLADGSDATKTPEGQQDAGGTNHDVPSAIQCAGCHAGTANWVLGFSAIQLSEAQGGISLADLTSRGLLSRPTTETYKLPGNPETQQVLGYLHANCAHCHNHRRPPSTSKNRCFDPRKTVDFSLRTEQLSSVESTPLFQTLNTIIAPGDPHESKLYERMVNDSRFLARMPPLGTEQIDTKSLELIEQWIKNLK